MALTWKEQLQNKCIETFGNKKGLALSKKYSQAFPASYTDDNTVDGAVTDIAYIEKLSPEKRLEINFY